MTQDQNVTPANDMPLAPTKQGLEQYGDIAEGTLISIAIETGISKKGPWKLYKLTLDDGQEYSQFDTAGALPPRNIHLETLQGIYEKTKVDENKYLTVQLAYTTKDQYKNVTAIKKTGEVDVSSIPDEVLNLDKYLKPRHPQDVLAMTYISSYERAVALYSIPHLYPQLAGSEDDKFSFDVIDELAEHIANTVLIRSGYREED